MQKQGCPSGTTHKLPGLPAVKKVYNKDRINEINRTQTWRVDINIAPKKTAKKPEGLKLI